MSDLSYPALLKLFPEHLSSKRSESASFLIWYLENYYRLDALEAVDSVCDQRGDKGIDGIFVNDNDRTITIFQSAISQKLKSSIGDASLREFAGTLRHFSSTSTIEHLVCSAGAAQVASLVKRLDLLNKITTHEIRGEFVSNIDLDANGESFLKTASEITFLGKTRLTQTFISNSRDIPSHPTHTFEVVGFDVAQYIVDKDTKAVIAPVKASQLTKLSGIADQSIYAYNVRGPLGKTQVNKDIVQSVSTQSLHKMFPLFHNGITIICRRLDVTKEKIAVTGYWVVNGCQSLTALYENTKQLTDDLRVLAKFIQMEPQSDLAEKVTRYSNNQNGVRPRDFMANNPIQIRLQNEIAKDYKGEYWYEIKRGEIPGTGIKLSNEMIGLYLMAFDLKQPWATHRKYQVFEDKHADLFARPELNSHRIVLCQVVMQAIDDATVAIKNNLCATYVLTKYFLLYCVREVLDDDRMAVQLRTDPAVFVRRQIDRDKFRGCIRLIVDDMIIDLNAEIDEYGADFDYRDKMREEKFVKELGKKIIGSYRKLVNRDRIKAFGQHWVAKPKKDHNGEK